MDIGTYPNYGKYDVTVSEPIDYVFVTKEHMTVHEYRVIDDKPNGEYMSDHNGLYVRATVKSMPILEPDAYVPAFDDSATLQCEPSDADGMTVRFPQAADAFGVPAMSYEIQITDAAGAAVASATLSGGLFLPTPPTTLTRLFAGLQGGMTYTVEITPVSLFGVKGTALKGTCTLEEAPSVEPVEMSKADIFDLAIRDGQPVDASPNALDIQTIGTPGVEGNALVFNGSGNYKVPGIKEHYAALADGFTAEIQLTVGNRVNGYSNPAANFHAGGFGYAVDAGKLTFQVRLDGVYVTVAAPIEANTTYHAVAVYNSELGLLALYLNGQLVDTAEGQNMTHPTDNGAKYLCLGADSDASGQGESPYTGSLQIFRLYDTPASAGEALWLYQQTQ